MTTPAEESKYWRTKSETLRRTQLETIQKAATGWSALLGALLGIFGAAAFAGGLTTIDKLAEPWATVAKGLTVAAALAGITATYRAAQAAGSLSPGPSNELDSDSIRERSTAAANTAFMRLRSAKFFTVIAAALVFIGSGIVLFAGEASTTKEPPTVVAVVAGTAACGAISEEDGVLVVDGTPLAAEVESITVVEACPD